MGEDRLERFWGFSTDLYARPGVETALLALQDEDGLDVSLLLFCFYVASRDRAVDRELAAAMIAVGENWGMRVVAPLRAVRRELKRLAPDGTLRAEVKRLELAAERAMHAELEALLPAETDRDADDRRALAERNLSTWLGARNLTLTAPARRARLAVVLDRAFP